MVQVVILLISMLPMVVATPMGDDFDDALLWMLFVILALAVIAALAWCGPTFIHKAIAHAQSARVTPGRENATEPERTPRTSVATGNSVRGNPRTNPDIRVSDIGDNG